VRGLHRIPGCDGLYEVQQFHVENFRVAVPFGQGCVHPADKAGGHRRPCEDDGGKESTDYKTVKNSVINRQRRRTQVLRLCRSIPKGNYWAVAVLSAAAFFAFLAFFAFFAFFAFVVLAVVLSAAAGAAVSEEAGVSAGSWAKAAKANAAAIKAARTILTVAFMKHSFKKFWWMVKKQR
jgi:hypothetical protein